MSGRFSHPPLAESVLPAMQYNATESKMKLTHCLFLVVYDVFVKGHQESNLSLDPKTAAIPTPRKMSSQLPPTDQTHNTQSRLQVNELLSIYFDENPD
jgi:hypothetical protein